MSSVASKWAPRSSAGTPAAAAGTSASTTLDRLRYALVRSAFRKCMSMAPDALSSATCAAVPNSNQGTLTQDCG